jgi:hypothetical protein
MRLDFLSFSVRQALAWICLLGLAGTLYAAPLQGPLVQLLPGLGDCESSVLSCNRLALEDAHTKAELDVQRREIKIANTHTYAANAIIADVLIHATTHHAQGRSPHLIHLVVSKKQDKIKVRLSPYGLPKQPKPLDAELDGWTVWVNNESEPVLSPAMGREALLKPGIGQKTKDFFVQAKELALQADGALGLELGLQVGPLRYRLTRTRFESPASWRLQPPTDLLAALQTHDWRIEFQSLSRLVPEELIRHDLFLFGIERLPLVQQAMQQGYKGTELLSFGAQQGKGYVQLGSTQEPFADASQAAALFLRDTYVGLLLMRQWHLDQRK